MNQSLANARNLSLADSCFLPLFQGIALFTVNCLISVFGTLGNLMVCIAVLVDRRLRRISHRLLVSLAIADLIVTMICEPLFLKNLFHRTFLQGCAISQLEFAYSILANTSCYASVVHLACVSVDRFIAVLFPLQHGPLMNNCGLFTMLVISWTIPISSPIFRMALPESFPSAIVASGAFALSYLIIIFSYLLIVVFLFYLKNKRRNIRTRSRSRPGKWSMEVRVTRTLAIVIGVFTACWMPLMAAMFATGKPLFKMNGPVHMWLRTLALSNSAMNFVIYTVRMPDFRQAYDKIYKKLCST